jgi:hypothetical protein
VKHGAITPQTPHGGTTSERLPNMTESGSEDGALVGGEAPDAHLVTSRVKK